MRYYLLTIEELQTRLLELFEEANREELEKFFQTYPDGPWWSVAKDTPNLLEVFEKNIDRLPPKWREAISEELEDLV